MAFKYQITDSSGIYFITMTVVDWIDVFTRKDLSNVILESLAYCQKNKGLVIYGWCLMPSHLHMIISTDNSYHIPDVIRDFKKFTAKKIVEVINQIHESRTWMLNKFQYLGAVNTKNSNIKFWQDGYHPILLETNKFLDQKLNYIHQNPVEAGLVNEPEYYAYSSAINYAGGLGLLEVVFIQ